MVFETIQVTTTTSDRADAERIAASLVAKRLAACVQIVGTHREYLSLEGPNRGRSRMAVRDQDGPQRLSRSR